MLYRNNEDSFVDNLMLGVQLADVSTRCSSQYKVNFKVLGSKSTREIAAYGRNESGSLDPIITEDPKGIQSICPEDD